MKIPVDKIDIGIPKFKWLCGRMSTDDFKRLHSDVYELLVDEGRTNKAQNIFDLQRKYEKYLFLPLLVEKIHNQRGLVYKLRDGNRRLTVLINQGNKYVDAELWRDYPTKKHWERGRLIDLQLEHGLINDLFPQKSHIKGEPPFNWTMHGGYVDSFLIATGVKVPYVLKSGDSLEARGDDFEGRMNPNQRLLVGFGKHEPICRKLGRQPLNCYLVGHFACGPNALKDPLVRQYGRFVRVQQYFRGGHWGLDVEGYPYNGVSTVKEQLVQTEVGITFLFKLGVLKAGTKIYFADQSADKPCPLHQYFKLFSGVDADDVLSQYFAWLPTYLRTCRRNHFNLPIEEVIWQIQEI